MITDTYQSKEKRMKQQCEDDIHDWEYSSWGVIIGVSKCRKCGKVAKEEDFNKTGK